MLGVDANATAAEVKAAYRKRIAEYHPDKVAALGVELRELAEEMSKRINAAYDILMSKFR